MKRSFLFLVLVFVSYYGYEAAVIYSRLSPLVYVENGKLSEFTASVIPVVLDTAGGPVIENPIKFKRDGGFLYFISNHVLYCFNEKGEFVLPITSTECMFVADYLIDTYSNQLIVLGNEDDIFYYTLEGELIRKMKYPKEDAYSRLRSVAYHQNRIWIIKETAPNGKEIKNVVVECDTNFVPLHTYALEMAGTCHKPELFTCLHPQFSVAPDTGEIYVYSSPVKPDYLLQDTLATSRERLLHPTVTRSVVQAYPFRIGNRFYVSSPDMNEEGENGYFYCFDDQKNKGWCLKDGITDDFYKTGRIPGLQPMDLTGDTYCFVKTGPDLYTCFPEIATRNVPVVFIVEMKC